MDLLEFAKFFIETTEAIPAANLAAKTRAYAKIIEQAKSMNLSELTQ